MKRRVLFFAIMIIAIMSVLAISASAENNIIKLQTLPTLEEIHANPEAYVSRVDALEETEYKAKDPDSVVVLSDLAETPTYYVYPCYYLIRGTSYNVSSTIEEFNSAISALNVEAFAEYTSDKITKNNGYMNGECDQIIRLEMPKYVTTITGNNKFQGCANIKELYIPTHVVEDAETGKLKEVAYITTISGQNLFSDCSSLEVIHNVEFLPIGIINPAGFSGCSSLEKFKFPAGVTSIPDSLFYGCSSLQNVEIPYGVTSIGASAFYKCSSMTEMILPNTVTSFAKLSFYSMTGLVTLNFGAGMTNIYSRDQNCENISGCTNIKYIYMPATFGTSIQNTGNQIFHNGTNVTFFFTGDLTAVNALKTRLSQASDNNLFINAEAYDYTAEENKDIDFKTYAQTQGKTIIVYNYNDCEAFYNNVHNYEGTGNCLDGVTCTQCDDNVTAFASHNVKETLTYTEFISTGIYNKFCSNASDCEYERVADKATAAIFFFNEENGFATNGDDGIAFGGYNVNIGALKEYNRVNPESKITFGVVMMNPKYLDGKTSFFKDGSVNAESGFIMIDLSDVEYTNISISITGFTGVAQDLSIILAIYAYTDPNNVEYIQSRTTACACENVTLGTERLYTVTLNSVKERNSDLSDLDEYVMPSKKEEETE